jgi:hypothetical protein
LLAQVGVLDPGGMPVVGGRQGARWSIGQSVAMNGITGARSLSLDPGPVVTNRDP